MAKKILKYMYKEIRETFTPKWWWLPLVILCFAVSYVQHKIMVASEPPPPTFTYTPPKWNLLEKWLEQQKEKFDNLRQQRQA